MRILDEAMADVTEFHSTQHDGQKIAWKANYLQIALRERETN